MYVGLPVSIVDANVMPAVPDVAFAPGRDGQRIRAHAERTERVSHARRLQRLSLFEDRRIAGEGHVVAENKRQVVAETEFRPSIQGDRRFVGRTQHGDIAGQFERGRAADVDRRAESGRRS